MTIQEKLDAFTDVDTRIEEYGDSLNEAINYIAKGYDISGMQLALWYASYKNSGSVNNS